jgi:uncharacterized Fe-S cluster protein YjdI
MTDLGAGAFDRGKQYVADDIVVSFDDQRCRHFAECVNGLPVVFDVGRRPWIDPTAAPADVIAEIIERCPSGALQYRRRDGADEVGDSVTSLTRLPAGQLVMRGRLEVKASGTKRGTDRNPDGGLRLWIVAGCALLRWSLWG